MDQIVNDVRRTQWLSIMSACQNRPEGLSVKRWLADNNIKEKSYYYWQRKFRKEACDQILPAAVRQQSEVSSPSFVELSLPKSSIAASPFDFAPDAVIRFEDCTIALSNNASHSLIAMIMEGIRNAR